MVYPSEYSKIGSLVCKLQTEKGHECADHWIIFGRHYINLGHPNIAIAYLTMSNDKSTAFGLMAMVYLMVEKYLKAYYYYLLASLITEKYECSQKLMDLSRSFVNRNQNDLKMATCALVAYSLIMITDKKYAALWHDALSWFTKPKTVGNLPKRAIETICLLIAYIHKKTGVYPHELDEIIVLYVKHARKADVEKLELAGQIFASIFPYGYSRKAAIMCDSELNYVIDLDKAKTTVWTIIDADILVQNFVTVKNLVFCGKIKLLIPLTVVRHMDRTKKNRHRIKEVTLYLDDLLKNHSDAIRFQTVYEDIRCDIFSLSDMLSSGPHLREIYGALNYFASHLNNCKYEIWSRNEKIIRVAMLLGIPLSKLQIESGDRESMKLS